MKKIVLSAIAALVATIGVYHIALLMGESESAAAVAVIDAAFTLIVTFVVAEQEHVRFRWVMLVYGLEGLAICGALAVGNVGWSAAIVLGGVAALLTLWRIAPKPSKEERADHTQIVDLIMVC